ncbi:MAG: energy transducer TonB [Pseudomonadales bacterium]
MPRASQIPLKCLFVVALTGFGSAVFADADHADTETADAVETYQGPKLLEVSNPVYPFSSQRRGEEGWVVMQYMIDTAGKPYEISVVDSVGNPQFSDAAIAAVERFTFQPAMADGQPIDAGNHYKIKFALEGGAAGARRKFVSEFKKLSKAMSAGDRQEVDVRFEKLEVTNLYEDAFYNYARAIYYANWGTPNQQLNAIRKAVAHETGEGYLRKAHYLSALHQRFGLEVQLRDFAAAQKTAALLMDVEKNESQLASVAKVNEQVEQFRDGSERFRVDANLGDRTSWWFDLFRPRFQVDISEGKIAELKLRCRRGYVFFRYDPQLEYSVSKEQMPCNLEVLGDPGTQFSIVQ